MEKDVRSRVIEILKRKGYIKDSTGDDKKFEVDSLDALEVVSALEDEFKGVEFTLMGESFDSEKYNTINKVVDEVIKRLK